MLSKEVNASELTASFGEGGATVAHITDSLRQRFLPDAKVEFVKSMPDVYVYNQPRSPKGRFRIATNTLEINVDAFSRHVAGDKTPSNGRTLCAIVQCAAHEATHSIVNEQLQNKLTPAEFDKFIDSVLDIDLGFRKRIIESYRKVMDATYYQPDSKAITGYLAGDKAVLDNLFQRTVPKEMYAGEFLAEMGALSLLDKLKPSDVPAPLQAVHAEIVKAAREGIGAFKTELSTLQVEDPQNTTKFEEVLKVMDWIRAGGNTADKPKWLEEPEAEFDVTAPVPDPTPEPKPDKPEPLNLEQAAKILKKIHYFPAQAQHTIVIDGGASKTLDTDVENLLEIFEKANTPRGSTRGSVAISRYVDQAYVHDKKKSNPVVGQILKPGMLLVRLPDSIDTKKLLNTLHKLNPGLLHVDQSPKPTAIEIS